MENESSSCHRYRKLYSWLLFLGIISCNYMHCTLHSPSCLQCKPFMHERGAEMMMLCCVRYKGCLITTPINDPSINDHIMVIAIIFWEGRGGNRRARNIKARVVFSCVMMTRLISLSSGLRVMLVAADLQNPFIFLGLHFSQRAPCWLLIRVIWWVEGAFTGLLLPAQENMQVISRKENNTFWMEEVSL